MPLQPVLAITQYSPGTPKATDVTVYTDTLDTTQAASGTTKSYQRGLEFNYYFGAVGIQVIAPVRLATTTNLNAIYNNGAFGVGATLTSLAPYGLLIIDGINCNPGDLILVWNQLNSAQNGIYTVTNIGTSFVPWVLTRATFYDVSPQVIEGQIVLVEQGNTQANVSYQQIASGPFVIGTTGIVFQRFDILNSAFVTFPSWISATSPSTNLIAGMSYIANNTGATNTFILPTTSAVGKTIDIAMGTANAWIIQQNADQSIRLGNLVTSTGVPGSIASTALGDSISLVCVVQDTKWVAYASIGNLTYI